MSGNGNSSNNCYYPDFLVYPPAPTGGPPLEPLSRYQTATQGWGSRKDFQASYKLGCDPSGIDEGNMILDALRYGRAAVERGQSTQDQAQQQKPQQSHSERPQANAEKK